MTLSKKEVASKLRLYRKYNILSLLVVISTQLFLFGCTPSKGNKSLIKADQNAGRQYTSIRYQGRPFDFDPQGRRSYAANDTPCFVNNDNNADNKKACERSPVRKYGCNCECVPTTPEDNRDFDRVVISFDTDQFWNVTCAWRPSFNHWWNGGDVAPCFEAGKTYYNIADECDASCKQTGPSICPEKMPLYPGSEGVVFLPETVHVPLK